MKASIEALYDRISNIKIADYKMKYANIHSELFCLYAIQIVYASGPGEQGAKKVRIV